MTEGSMLIRAKALLIWPVQAMLPAKASALQLRKACLALNKLALTARMSIGNAAERGD